MPTALASETRLRALSIGAAASSALSRGRASLRVHSVFSSVVNLEVEGAGILVALSGPSGAAYPHAVVLGRAPCLLPWPLEAGRGGRLVGSMIRIEGSFGSMAIDLGRARVRPERTLPPIFRLGSAYRACADELARLQAKRCCDLRLDCLSDSTDSASEDAMGAMGRELRRSALAFGRAAGEAAAEARRRGRGDALGHSESLRRSVASLVGKGGGLTPAGDDFLCGFMAAARCATGDSGPPAGGARMRESSFAGELGGAVEESVACTNLISASLLRCAAGGHWLAPLADLAEAIASEREFEALRSLGELCGLGHSSGADIATGFFFGLGLLTVAATGMREATAGN